MAADGQSTEVWREERLLIDGALVPASGGEPKQLVSRPLGLFAKHGAALFCGAAPRACRTW